MSHTDFSSALVARGAISQPQAEDLSRQGVVAVGAVASKVLASGWASESAVCSALAEVVAAPAVVLSESTLDLSALAFLPEALALERGLLPIRINADVIEVATTSLDAQPVHELLSSMARRQIVLFRAIDDVLHQTIATAYRDSRAGAKVLRGHQSKSTAPELTLVHPAPRSQASELSSLIRGLSQSLTVLRAAARVEREPAPPTSSIPASQTAIPVVPASATPPPPPLVSVNPVILVVEDDDAIRRLIVQALREDGRNIVEAADGTAAFAILRTTKPVLVVLDAMLPGIHGFEICTNIKKSAYRDVRVIMISAVYRGWEQAKEIQENHGADAFLEKPFNVAVLRAMVANVLGLATVRTPLPPNAAELIANVRIQLNSHRAAARWDEAIECVDEWIMLDTFDSAAHVERGNLLLQHSEYSAAMSAYETAVAFDRTSFSAHANLARVLEHLGFRRKSDETWRRAAQLAPNGATRQKILERLDPPA